MARPLPGNADQPAATPGAQRQQRYRQARRQAGGPMEERLDIMLDLHARMALKRLARHYGLSQKAALEKILLDQQRAVAEASSDAGEQYYRDL